VSPDEVEDKAEYLREVTSSQGLEIVNLCSYIQAAEIKTVERLCKAAEKAGAQHVRVWAPFYDGQTSYTKCLQDTRSVIKEVEQLAKQYHRKAVFEIHHGTIMCSASLARNLVDGFDPESVGIIYDPGNMINEGMENWKMGIEVLGEYLAYVHFKNAGWIRKDGRWQCEWLPMREGMVDWSQVMRALAEVGFDGYLSNEDFSPVPIDVKLKDDLAYLKEIERSVTVRSLWDTMAW
jgi:sugar phosphate isomerase/epimerase